MAETYEHSKAKVRPRILRERFFLALSLAMIAVVVGHRIGTIAGWW